MIPTKLLPLELASPKTAAEWLDEPDLTFANGNLSPDPKVGIPLYGPRSLETSRHKSEIHVGFIGTSETVAKAGALYERCSQGIDGDDDHEPFPGCNPNEGFRCELTTDLTETIRQHEYDLILGERKKRQKFETLLGMLQQKMNLITGRDHPLDYIVVALPDELYKKCRSVEYTETGVGRVYRNLRRSFKAMAMHFDTPTQILLEKTIDNFGTDKTTVQPSQVAWDLFTGMYFKVEGLPWGPTGLRPGTCYIGISFFRPLGDSSSFRTSVVPAFADHKRDTSRTKLLREVLVLTKMNWNSANMFGLMPITLRFSRLVGDILRGVPENEKPRSKYKFYMSEQVYVLLQLFVPYCKRIYRLIDFFK